jgi:hypothetical protein
LWGGAWIGLSGFFGGAVAEGGGVVDGGDFPFVGEGGGVEPAAAFEVAVHEVDEGGDDGEEGQVGNCETVSDTVVVDYLENTQQKIQNVQYVYETAKVTKELYENQPTGIYRISKYKRKCDQDKKCWFPINK